jgi:hypothetical protein
LLIWVFFCSCHWWKASILEEDKLSGKRFFFSFCLFSSSSQENRLLDYTVQKYFYSKRTFRTRSEPGSTYF